MRPVVTLRGALGLVAFQAVFLLVARLAMAELALQAEAQFAPTALTFAALLCTAVVTCGVVWWGCVRHRGWRNAGWNLERPWLALGAGLCTAAVCIGIVFALVVATGASPAESLAALTGPSLEHRAVYAAIGAQAAFTEETLFRGALQEALEQRMAWWPAVLVMAVVFALYHLTPGPLGLAAKLVFGVVFALVRRATGTLAAPALGHFLFWVVAGTV